MTDTIYPNGIEDVAVERGNGARYHVSWVREGARFHVWADNWLNVSQNVIFKNPPLHLCHRDPGYFPTRHLDAKAKANAEVLATVFEIAVKGEFFAAADRAYDAKQAAERQELEDRIRQGRITRAAPELYEALSALVGAFCPLDEDRGDVWNKALDALVKANDGETK